MSSTTSTSINSTSSALESLISMQRSLPKLDPKRWPLFMMTMTMGLVLLDQQCNVLSSDGILMFKNVTEDKDEFMTYRMMAAQYVFMLDRDDEWNEDYLKKALLFLESISEAEEEWFINMTNPWKEDDSCVKGYADAVKVHRDFTKGTLLDLADPLGAVFKNYKEMNYSNQALPTFDVHIAPVGALIAKLKQPNERKRYGQYAIIAERIILMTEMASKSDNNHTMRHTPPKITTSIMDQVKSLPLTNKVICIKLRGFNMLVTEVDLDLLDIDNGKDAFKFIKSMLTTEDMQYQKNLIGAFVGACLHPGFNEYGLSIGRSGTMRSFRPRTVFLDTGIDIVDNNGSYSLSMLSVLEGRPEVKKEVKKLQEGFGDMTSGKDWLTKVSTIIDLLMEGPVDPLVKEMLQRMGCEDVRMITEPIMRGLWLSDKYLEKKSGKKLYSRKKEEFPFARAEYKGYKCASCKKVDPEIRLCSCKRTYYCSKDCQKKHWSEHKAEHKILMRETN